MVTNTILIPADDITKIKKEGEIDKIERRKDTDRRKKERRKRNRRSEQ